MHLSLSMKSSIEEAYKVKMTNEQWDTFKYRLKVAERNCGYDLFGDIISDTIAEMRNEEELQDKESSGEEEEPVEAL